MSEQEVEIYRSERWCVRLRGGCVLVYEATADFDGRPHWSLNATQPPVMAIKEVFNEIKESK